jgi:putative hydrolase of the HAD superfamily
MMTIQAVLFDFAGTLFMPQPASQFVRKAANDLGLDLSPDDCERLAAECLKAGFPGGPYPETVPEHLRALYEQRDFSSDAHRTAYTGLLSTVEFRRPGLPEAIYEQIREPTSWIPYPDTRGVIEALHRRDVRAGVISNVGFDLRPILHADGFEDLACRCTMSFEVGAAKPDPRIFEAALDTLQADASRTLMVGDHETVDRGGEMLGIQTVILPMTAPGSDHGLSRILELL